MTAQPPRSGYTLLEVLLVVAILVILSAVSMPTLESMYGDTRVRGAGDEVRRACAEARARAIDSGGPFRFSIHEDSKRYRVAADTSDAWPGTTDVKPGDESDDGKTLVGSLPKGISFEKIDAPDDGGGWHTVTVFLPDGACRKDARLVVQPDDHSSPLIINIRQLTGMVSVRTKKQEEAH